MPDAGVNIPLKELYDLVQEMARSQQRIESRLDKMETKLEAKLETADKAYEKGQTALQEAEKAMTKAMEAYALAGKVERDQKWLWKTIIGALIVGAIGALFYFARGG